MSALIVMVLSLVRSLSCIVRALGKDIVPRKVEQPSQHRV